MRISKHGLGLVVQIIGYSNRLELPNRLQEPADCLPLNIIRPDIRM
jgi:hypothetical protein